MIPSKWGQFNVRQATVESLVFEPLWRNLPKKINMAVNKYHPEHGRKMRRGLRATGTTPHGNFSIAWILQI
jgi:hypothetical protein